MKKKNAFTLIELLVWMSIIVIIALWTTKINFNYSTNNQKLEIFTNSISSEIERVRNNSLIWKWVWVELNLPNKRKIDFSISWSWVMITSYSTWTVLGADKWQKDNSLYIKDWYSIDTINCPSPLFPSIPITLTATESWTIVFEGWDINLANDCLSALEITINSSYANNSNIIEFNTINWLIKR